MDVAIVIVGAAVAAATAVAAAALVVAVVLQVAVVHPRLPSMGPELSALAGRV